MTKQHSILTKNYLNLLSLLDNTPVGVADLAKWPNCGRRDACVRAGREEGLRDFRGEYARALNMCLLFACFCYNNERQMP